MNRAVQLLLPLLTACASFSGGGTTTGAASPNAAIREFLAAARAKNLSSMASVWGTEKGPASKTMNKTELERRELIMIQCLAHDQATLGTPAPAEAGRLRIPVELTLVTLKANPTFTVVKGPSDRWYVWDLDIDQLRDRGFCGATTTPPAPGSTR